MLLQTIHDAVVLLGQVLDGSQVMFFAFWEHNDGVMCAERSRAGLSSLQNYQINISLKHQCLGLCLQYSKAEQLAPRQHWLSLFSSLLIGYLLSQIDNQNCLLESDGDRYRNAIGKWGTGCFPAFQGKKYLCSQRPVSAVASAVCFLGNLRRGKAQIAKLDVEDSPKNHCFPMPESTKEAIKKKSGAQSCLVPFPQTHSVTLEGNISLQQKESTGLHNCFSSLQFIA